MTPVSEAVGVAQAANCVCQPPRRRWHQSVEKGSRWGINFMAWSCRLFGWRLASWFIYPLVGYFFLRSATERRASWEYLQHLKSAHPDAALLPNRPSWRHSYRHFLEFSLTILDRLAIFSGRACDYDIVRHGQELMVALAAKKQGAVLLGAHLGSLDAMCLLAKEKGMVVNVLTFRANSRNISGVLEQLQAQGNLHIIEYDPTDGLGVFELMACIRRGEFVAINGDRTGPRLGQRRDRVSWVPFLGQEAPFPQGPLILASLLECPVLLTVGLRTGAGTYHLYAEEFAQRIVLPKGMREQQLQHWLAIYAQRLEQYCCQAPYQWFNFYDFWSE